ncbi:hypothetical protein SteCoe_6053 [Stentor coeruleus]|uniref:LsmAD domain-containing protein n=1 Tax=Stentor coeruleus TaxID=5963 RepID=A0A1R2CQT5_9CILI|nr:hypothetical protein SteCoe_6053 [Stentor coeruleus]
MKQRTLWAILSTLSRSCNLKKSDNTTQSGIIHTLCKKGAILLSKSKTNVAKTTIPFETIISLECPNVHNTIKHKFQTDQEISKNLRVQKRRLQHWEGEESTSLTFDIKDYKGWNQFETNATKFGVVSTYDENLYTTPVPHISELTEEQVIRAKNVEKELNSFVLEKDEENEDEEALFGAVLGSGRYAGVKPTLKNSQKKGGDKEKSKKHREVNKNSGKYEVKEQVTEKIDMNTVNKNAEMSESIQKKIGSFDFNCDVENKGSIKFANNFSKERTSKISFFSRESSETKVRKAVVVEAKQNYKSVTDLYITTWAKCIKHN